MNATLRGYDDDIGGAVKYASFKYELRPNLGDEIQTLATEQHLPRVDTRVERDSLAMFEADEAHVIVFQGWFSHTPERCLPPSEAIVPIFVGFHISGSRKARDHLLRGPGLSYLKAHEPIGCRDGGTRRLLEGVGVRAYTTYCLTLTFPTRVEEPSSGKVFIVDGWDLRVKRSLRRGASWLTHDCPASLDDVSKRKRAQQLLDIYRNDARLVITTKLHCALPCIAMGTPVVFFGDPDDYRLGILQDLGVPINRLVPKHRILRGKRFPLILALWRRWNAAFVDWNPRPINVDKEKQQLREVVRWQLRAVAESTEVEEATPEVPDRSFRRAG